MIRRRYSVRTQLVWWNIFALALLLGALGGVVRALVGHTILASVDRDLDARTRPMTDHFFPGGPPFGPPPQSDHPHGFDHPQGVNGSHGFGHPPPFDHPHEFDHGFGPPGEFGGHGAFADRNPYRPGRFDLAGHSLNPVHPQDTLWDPRAFARAKLGQPLYTTVTVDNEPVRVFSRPFPRQGPI